LACSGPVRQIALPRLLAGSDISTYLQDLDDVRAPIQLYLDGSSGDLVKLKQAFHPDARMFGHVGQMDTCIPVGACFDLVQAQPGMAGSNYKATVQHVDLTGDAGVAVLVETDYLGCDFVDCFSVARIAERWQLTNKTDAHTGWQLAAR